MFTPTAEQEELRATLRRFFAECSPEAAVRQSMQTEEGLDPALWTRLVQELGLLGLAVPEDLGGQGYGFAEACLVLEEAGRAGVCAPLLSSLAQVVPLLLHAADEVTRRELLPAVVAGELRAAVGWAGPGSDLARDDTGGAPRLSGTVGPVLDGGAADVLLLVVPGAAGGRTLHRVSPDGSTLRRRDVPDLDLTRRRSSLTLHAATAPEAAQPGPDLERRLDRVRDLGLVGLAAEQVGGAQRALDESVAFARQRVQFGRVIGSFQAVKHRLVDMLVAVETARSAAYDAIDAAGAADDPALARSAAVAASYCAEAFSFVAEEAIQVHGGLGFTWEHPAHLWFRRAKADAVLLGRPAQHRARLAASLAGPPP